MKKIFILTVVALGMTLQVIASAAMAVPADLQVALFYKIFDFDQSLSVQTGQEIVIGIFYDPNDPQSKEAKEEVEQSFSGVSDKAIAGKRAVIKEITSVDQLDGVNIIYVTPGNDSSIKEIVRKCETDKIFGISATEAYARQGLALAIGVENNRPKIIVNRATLGLSGVKLSSQLLALAQII
ncbi:MAG: YfiR family protein [Candidatus Omnitrophica bacterium]|nr:YfiR family protein [Candidatus Omnitrophota bacterium]MDE2213781.1 YfiR family protein [Candidatus Omnitrophota bacterium]MDE2230643.1 YfiR family protein [Candidatus Omnitrophota bacterium]